MKFDFVIGNPPYQGEHHMQLYPSFYLAGQQIADCVDMIFPTGWQEPKNGKNLKLMNTVEVKEDPQIVLIDNKQNVFNGVSGAEWTNIILWKKGYDNGLNGKQLVYTNGESPQEIKLKTQISESQYVEVNSILEKTKKADGFTNIISIIHLQTKLNLDNIYEDYPNDRKKVGSNGVEKRIVTNSFTSLSIFHNEEKENDVTIHGIIDHSRLIKYTNKKYIIDDNLNYWKVVLPAAGYGVINDDEKVPVISFPFLAKPGVGFSQSFISFGSFVLEQPARNCEKYIKTKYFRFMVGTLKTTQHNHKDVFANVPLQDFTENSDIDWSKSVDDIDKQLYKKYELSQKEISFIETHVKEMA